MFLCRLTLGIVPQSFIFYSIPVWVKLSHIPLELWTPRGLSVIASGLGTSLCLDKAIEDQSRLSYAWVRIEIRAYSTFPTSINIWIRGVLFTTVVDYA